MVVLFLVVCVKMFDWDYDKLVDFSNYKIFFWVFNVSLIKNVVNY